MAKRYLDFIPRDVMAVLTALLRVLHILTGYALSENPKYAIWITCVYAFILEIHRIYTTQTVKIEKPAEK